MKDGRKRSKGKEDRILADVDDQRHYLKVCIV